MLIYVYIRICTHTYALTTRHSTPVYEANNPPSTDSECVFWIKKICIKSNPQIFMRCGQSPSTSSVSSSHMYKMFDKHLNLMASMANLVSFSNVDCKLLTAQTDFYLRAVKLPLRYMTVHCVLSASLRAHTSVWLPLSASV